MARKFNFYLELKVIKKLRRLNHKIFRRPSFKEFTDYA